MISKGLGHELTTLHTVEHEEPEFSLANPSGSFLQHVELDLVKQVHYVTVSQDPIVLGHHALFSHPRVGKKLAEVVSSSIR